MKRPNIVWLTSDHMVWAHHKRLTGYPVLPTLERLSAEGLTFNNAFSVTPLCQPCRASMLTGQYAHKHGMLQNDGLQGAKLDFDVDEQLFNTPMLDAGYRMGYFGKWHTGVERTAEDFGFEGFSCPGYGHPYWTQEYEDYLERHNLPHAEVTIERWVGHPGWEGRKIRLADFDKPYESPYQLMEASGVLNELESHEAYFLADLSNRWLAEVARGDDPFCMRVDLWGPHHPFWVAEPYLNTIDPADLPPYPTFNSNLDHRPQNHRDLLAYRREFDPHRNWDDWSWYLARCHEHATLCDDALGRILYKLDELGLAENTIVVYTVDHGGALCSNGELVDKGWMMSDETMRIPMAVRWPGKVEAGSTSDAFVMNMDLVPTAQQAAGATVPAGTDGTSLLDLIQAPATTPWRDDIMLEHHGHYGETHFQRQLRWGNYKYVAHLDDLGELYDIEADPFETRNLINDEALRPVLTEMQNRLKRWMAEHDDSAADANRLLAQLAE